MKSIALLALLGAMTAHGFEIEMDGELVDTEYASRVCISMGRVTDQYSQHRDGVERTESQQCFLTHPWNDAAPLLPVVRIQLCRTADPEALWSSGGCSGFHRVDRFVVE